MSLLGIALCLLLLICWIVNRWFGQKVQQSLAVAERLRPLSEQFSTSVTLDVVIPAYNEEVYLRECVEAVLKSLDQFSGTGKVWIADDQSTDATLSIAKSLAEQDSRVEAIAVPGRPQEVAWQGKNWACHYVSQQCQSDYILFIDADVLLKPECLAAAIQEAENSKTALLTLFPQVNCSFWGEWLVQPPIFGLITGSYNFDALGDPQRQDVAFGFGPFMLFDRSAYESIGGHQRVAENPVEDVALAKVIKRSNLKLKAMLGYPVLTVRMYANFSQLWEGWTKNFHMGSGSSIFTSLQICLVSFLVWSMPFFAGVGAIAFEIFAWREHQLSAQIFGGIAIALAVVLIDGLRRYRQLMGEMFPKPMKYGYLSFLGGIIVALIAIASMIKTETGWGWTWRGRSLVGSNAAKT